MFELDTHPTPQFAREDWVDLCGEWQFTFDDDDVGLGLDWQSGAHQLGTRIQVPFPPESPASGVGDTGFHRVVWYKRTFTLDSRQRSRRVLLRFGAVDYEATVWLNGQLVAKHRGGSTPFSADVTHALATGDAGQVIVVRAEDDPSDLMQPRGKQDWQLAPHRIWYHRTTGIWQPVWLEFVGETFIEEIRWTPDARQGMLQMSVRLNAAPSSPLTVRVRLFLHGDPLGDDVYRVDQQELRRGIALEIHSPNVGREDLLWSPRHPNLIDAEVTLLDGETTLDTIHSYAGLRSAAVSRGRFLLNERPFYLRLVLEQGYWPSTHLAAPSNEAVRHEVELIKSLGFNGVRIHQKVEDPRFLYWCDRLGLLVWGEMANAYAFAPTAVERLTTEWIEVLRRDYSHPCIVTWVPLNESWGVPGLERDPAQQHYVQALYHLTHALDPTRPVIGNDGWEHIASDIWGIHDYALDGDTIRERYGSSEAVERTLRETQPHSRALALAGARREGEPIVLTEYGGISYEPAGGQHWFGYGTVRTAEEYLHKYEELISAVLDCASVVGFCYTQLTDTEQETNGLLHADRTPKLDTEKIRQITSRPSKALPGEIFSQIQAAEITPFQS